MDEYKYEFQIYSCPENWVLIFEYLIVGALYSCYTEGGGRGLTGKLYSKPRYLWDIAVIVTNFAFYILKILFELAETSVRTLITTLRGVGGGGNYKM